MTSLAEFGISSREYSHSTMWVGQHLPTNFRPADSSSGTYFGFTSYRCLCLSSILSWFPYNCSEIQNNQDIMLVTKRSFTPQAVKSQRQDMKSKWSKQIYTTLNTELYLKRHMQKGRCCWEHIKTLCYKGMNWVWIQRHTKKDFNLCKGLKIFIKWAVVSKIDFNSNNKLRISQRMS